MMRNRVRSTFLILTVLVWPLGVVAQNVNIEAQNIDVEFESYGSCPLYLVPGTSDYNLCRQQQREYDRRIPVRYREEINLDSIEERGDDLRFNVKERYE